MRTLIVAVLLLTVGCATSPHPTHGAWTKEAVVGLSMKLVDTKRVEDYRFARGGYVSATVGTQELLAGPLWEWRIRDGRLQVLDSGKVIEDFTLLRMDDRIITVRRRDGSSDRFRYEKA